MANDREETHKPEDKDGENIKDLDVNPDEVDKVKGGRRRAEDPCAGGEAVPRP